MSYISRKVTKYFSPPQTFAGKFGYFAKKMYFCSIIKTTSL